MGKNTKIPTKICKKKKGPSPIIDIEASFSKKGCYPYRLRDNGKICKYRRKKIAIYFGSDGFAFKRNYKASSPFLLMNDVIRHL